MTDAPDRIAEAITEWFGERCDTFDADCPCCRAWRQYDTLSALREALEPFAEVDGEGDEDFGDDTQVVVKYGRTTYYALRLMDFRRARTAVYEADCAALSPPFPP